MTLLLGMAENGFTVLHLVFQKEEFQLRAPRHSHSSLATNHFVTRVADPKGIDQ